MMASLWSALIFLKLIQLASSQPEISFPFNAQLPPAARIDKFFSYTFSPYTFKSESEISYSLGRHPQWLSLESNGRRLYGTPQANSVEPGSVVGQVTEIVARDGSGSTTMNATLVVSRNDPPTVRIPLPDQIGKFGNFSAPSAVLMYPSVDFGYSFDPDTFQPRGLSYYAVSADSSPLPAWIKFDAGSLTFSGKTPPAESLIQPPQTFDFKLVASDIVGFSAASISFSIVVGSRKLTADKPVVVLNATRGSQLTYTGLGDDIRLDGKKLSVDELKATAQGLPGWLSFDAKTGTLSGTPNQGDPSTNFTVGFQGPSSTSVNVLVIVNVATNLFASTLEDVMVRPGDNFQLDLSSHFRDAADVDVRVAVSPEQSWLRVDGLQLSGLVPTSARGSFEVSVEAASKSSDLRESDSFTVAFLAPDGTTSSASASLLSSPTSTMVSGAQTSSPVTDLAATPPGRASTKKIVLATILPIVSISFLVMVLVCVFRRRRATATYISNKYRSGMVGAVASSMHVNESASSSMREVGGVEGSFVRGNTPFKAAKTAYGDGQSQSSRRRSSETLGRLPTLDLALPQVHLGGYSRTATIRSVGSAGSEDGRRSWFTVEGTTTGERSLGSEAASQRSGGTLPETRIQIRPSFLPNPDLSDFRSDLDMSIAAVEELSSVQPTPVVAYERRQQDGRHLSVGHSSVVTSSSAALPTLSEKQGREEAGEAEDSRPNWERLGDSEAEESVGELPEPGRAPYGRRMVTGEWRESESAKTSKSFVTETSFGSSENWRVIGKREGQGAASVSYKSLVDEAPFNPARGTGTTREEGRTQDEGGSEVLMSPSQWGNETGLAMMRPRRPPSSRASDGPVGSGKGSLGGLGVVPSPGGSRGGEEEEGSARAGAGWGREESEMISEGSFKVFL